MRKSVARIAFCGVLAFCSLAQAGGHSLVRGSKPSPDQHHLVSEFPDSCRLEKTESDGRSSAHGTHASQFESVQIETSDIALYEKFFEAILHAETVEKVDHPEKDSIRGYCYRNLHIVIRHDFQHPRPTGWIQVNFEVQDAQSIHDALKQASEESLSPGMSEMERFKVMRLKLKPEVTRGHRKARRLEVYGPEGFLMGFNQYQTIQ